MVATSDPFLCTNECLSQKGMAQKFSGHEPQPTESLLHRGRWRSQPARSKSSKRRKPRCWQRDRKHRGSTLPAAWLPPLACGPVVHSPSELARRTFPCGRTGCPWRVARGARWHRCWPQRWPLPRHRPLIRRPTDSPSRVPSERRRDRRGREVTARPSGSKWYRRFVKMTWP